VAGGKSNLSFMIIILVIVIVDVVGGYFIGRKVMVPYTYEREVGIAEEKSPEAGKEREEGSTIPGQQYPLEPINLNPANSEGEIFSCTLTLVTHDAELLPELEQRETQIIDIILNYLSAKTTVELNDVTNRETYKKEIIEKINSVLTTGQITNLYITQWIIQ